MEPSLKSVSRNAMDRHRQSIYGVCYRAVVGRCGRDEAAWQTAESSGH